MSAPVNVVAELPSSFEVETSAVERKINIEPQFFDGLVSQNLLYLTVKVGDRTDKVILKVKQDGTLRLYTRGKVKVKKKEKTS